MSDWPNPYHDDGPNTEPSWSRAETLDAGLALANRMLNDRAFALSYLNVVKQYYQTPGDYLRQYATLIERAYPSGDMRSFDANDFANVHRAAWLYLFEAFSALVDKNLHGNQDWGDPLPDETSNGEPEGSSPTLAVHNIPNSRGYFALNSSRDVPAPPVNRFFEVAVPKRPARSTRHDTA